MLTRRRLLAGAVAFVVTGGAGEASARRPAQGPRDRARTARDGRRIVADAISYARAQTGKGYRWGGVGPDLFDCSGLVMMAYQAAGIGIPRTSQEQWAAGPRVSGNPQPGDLVFFPGTDGTRGAPGHVGLVTGDGTMIQAYAPGIPIGSYPFGGPGALDGTGPGDIAGYTRPAAR